MSQSDDRLPKRLEGVAFWERGRLAYNGAQLLITVVMTAWKWPESRFLFTDNWPSYLGFALVANILYSLAYIPEIIFRIPSLRPHVWPIRWVILIGGTLYACFLTTLALELFILRDPSEINGVDM